MNFKNKAWMPALLTLGVLTVIVFWVIQDGGGDPFALVRIGTMFSQGDPDGTEGYDGQFVYYIARDLNPESVAPLLDVPAYRYQRILLPLLARALSFGNLDLLPWILAGLGLLTQFWGTWAVGMLLKKWGVSAWYAAVYGLWVGFVLAVRLDLPEPLAYGLVIGAILAIENERHWLAWVFYGLALFAKDVTLIFVAAQGIVYLSRRDWRRAVILGSITLLPYMIFQFWLLQSFGRMGLGSGGMTATSFEWIPFMGLFRLGEYNLVLLFAYLVVFGPTILFPTVWGLWKVYGKITQGQINCIVVALGLQNLSILFLPFSTFVEPGGLLRYACGLVLVVLLFAGRYRHKKALRYAPLWLVLNTFLLIG